jgi:hypothetical protein
VFAGEVVVAMVLILLAMRWIADAPATGARRRLEEGPHPSWVTCREADVREGSGA